MSDEELKEMLGDMADQQKKLVEKIHKDPEKKKDFWDKFSKLSTFLSSVLIALIGLYFTQTYNERQSQRNAALREQQIRLNELQTIEKFIPHLTGSEESKKVAILAITSLGNTELATRLAEYYKSEGTVSALTSIATAGREEDRKLARNALGSIFSEYRQGVVQITSGDARASGIIVTSNGHILTTDYALRNKNVVDVTTWDKTTHKATLEAVDNNLGLAVIKVSGTNYVKLTLASTPATKNEEVLAIGSTGAELAVSAVGRVDEVDERFVRILFKRKTMGGFGGGPVINIQGEVVGIVFQGRRDPSNKGLSIDECIRSDIGRSYLKSIGIEL